MDENHGKLTGVLAVDGRCSRYRAIADARWYAKAGNVTITDRGRPAQPEDTTSRL